MDIQEKLSQLRDKYKDIDVSRKYKKYKFESEEFYNDEFENEIRKYHYHLDLVKNVASAFYGDSINTTAKDTGYSFQFTEPLIETGDKNFDLLLSNKLTKSILLLRGNHFRMLHHPKDL